MPKILNALMTHLSAASLVVALLAVSSHCFTKNSKPSLKPSVNFAVIRPPVMIMLIIVIFNITEISMGINFNPQHKIDYLININVKHKRQLTSMCNRDLLICKITYN